MDLWSAEDFERSKDFWNEVGHEAALPIRFANLIDFVEAVESLNSSSQIFLHGRTLHRALSDEALLPDHDDDVLITRVSQELLRSTSAAGFTLIRELDIDTEGSRILSFERYGRYIDLHLRFGAEHSNSIARKLVLYGREFLYLEASAREAGVKYANHAQARIGQRILNVRKTFEQYNSKSEYLALASRQLRSTVRGALHDLLPQKKPSVLNVDEFLKLEFDFADSMNWTLRGKHYEPLFRRGETLGSALVRLKKDFQDEDKLIEILEETDLSSPVLEPVGLNREFWSRGNNFFVAPFITGFRHLVTPYTKANTYIATISAPNLYSLEYYDGLPIMSDSEIEFHLRNEPLEVRRGSFRSGRHRVAAMLGRLFRDEEYVPIAVEK